MKKKRMMTTIRPPEYGDAATGEAEDQEEPDDVPDDDLRRLIVDAKR